MQTFFAGMAAVARIAGWENHVSLGHSLGLPLLLMLITMYTGQLPRPMKRLTWLLFAVYFVQADIVIFMREDFPLVSAIHPVLALIDFALGWHLALRANKLIASAAKSVN